MGPPDVNSKTEKDPYAFWRDPGTGMRLNMTQITKGKEVGDFAVGLGAQVFESGQHEFDFSITRHGDGYVYVGVARPDIETDKTWCRKSAIDKVRGTIAPCLSTGHQKTRG
eukprot:689126-Rhodomonas_salina.2